MADDHKTPSPSFRGRRRNSTLKISCFRNRHSPTPSPPIIKSPSSFLRSNLKINDKRRHQTIIRRHRQRSSTEFTYDPLSYSLNFEEQGLHTPNFMSKLPVTPPATNKLEDSTRVARTDRDA
ncbi:hypothetical protein L1987_68609 [Smallanthus sonchifolius]|uniref:Uncharacterized protein n=1 Tax=Smallanthus sonchifolius TaxID=185202 RepID=A0ACB9B5Y1_9ASTR|nr:hypothetical protein L1987_68609 [Smallanthus sonchifolius]